jgi:hypothetical protein
MFIGRIVQPTTQSKSSLVRENISKKYESALLFYESLQKTEHGNHVRRPFASRKKPKTASISAIHTFLHIHTANN